MSSITLQQKHRQVRKRTHDLLQLVKFSYEYSGFRTQIDVDDNMTVRIITHYNNANLWSFFEDMQKLGLVKIFKKDHPGASLRGISFQYSCGPFTSKRVMRVSRASKPSPRRSSSRVSKPTMRVSRASKPLPRRSSSRSSSRKSNSRN